MKKGTKIRIIVYGSLMLVAAIYAFTWSPIAIQTRNMREARKQIRLVEDILQKDDAFESINFAVSTAWLGRLIAARGCVKSQEDLDRLKSVIDKNISRKYEFIFAVSVEDRRRNNEQ